MGMSQPVALVVELLILFSMESSSFSLASSRLGFLEVEVWLASWVKVLSSGQPRCLKPGGLLILEGGQQGTLEVLSFSVMPLAQRSCACSDLDQAAASSPGHQVNMTLNKFLPT